MTRLLQINFEKCSDCGTCERLLPKFKSKYDGKIEVSQWAFEREDVQKGMASVVENCPTEAITIITFQLSSPSLYRQT